MEITLIPNGFILKSNIKLADYNVLKSANPDALSVKDEDGNDIFTVNYGAKANIAQFAITFNGTSDDGKLVLTSEIPAGVDASNYVADLLMKVKTNLEKLETTIPTTASSITNERTAFIASFKKIS